MTQLLSFHNDAAIKKKYLARVRAHARADELVQGVTWKNGKGCAIGCTLEAYNHALYPVELGIPEVLARLEDRIFEGLSPSEAQRWPASFLSSIRVGRDLSEVWPKFSVWLLRDVRKYAAPDGKTVIDGVIAYFRLPPATRTLEKARQVRAAAASAAADAVYDAAASYAASAYAAYAAAASAAAASAAYAAAADASIARGVLARQKHFTRQAGKMLNLLRAA